MNGEGEPARFRWVLDLPGRAIDLTVIHVGVEHVGVDVAFHVSHLRFHLVAPAPFLELLLSDFVIEF
ncbi:hypothetical protein D3C85_1684750 [compost metagenome]